MSDCCHALEPKSKNLHLVIMGGGSAAFSAAIKANELGTQVTIINDGLPIGGTCVNVGCVPSKTLIRAAEAHHRASHHNFLGINSQSKITSFKEIIAQKRQLVEELRQAKYLNVVSDLPDVRIIKGHGQLIDRHTVEVNGEKIRADRILIATGVSPSIPDIPGLKEAGYLTNETAFELEKLPESLIVLGGRYVALECAQMFARFGSKVTILQRSSRILPTETPDLTDELTKYLLKEGIEIVTGVGVEEIRKGKDRIFVKTNINGAQRVFDSAHILVATGRRPNTQNLGLEKVGVRLNDSGYIQVNENLQTNVEGIYGAGDVIGDHLFVYTAAYEGALVAENALINSKKVRDYTILPWVIFTDPQVAGVGLDEQQAKQQGIDFDVAKVSLAHVPRAIAARDTRGFIKLIRDKKKNKLIGARILAPEGGELLMEISLAIKFGIPINELIFSFHPYLTLSEGVKLTAITFEKDVGKLSCCAA